MGGTGVAQMPLNAGVLAIVEVSLIGTELTLLHCSAISCILNNVVK